MTCCEALATTNPIHPTSSEYPRASRKDLYLGCVYPRVHLRAISGVIPLPCLPPYVHNMAPTTRSSVPATSRVISPSPIPSELQDDSRNAYTAPVTRSAARRRIGTSPAMDENSSEENLHESTGMRRARSRSPVKHSTNGRTPRKPVFNGSVSVATNGKLSPNAHLSPASAFTSGWSWRDISRSPSPPPLGLLPIHSHWRSFIHRHEVPRKLLHVSIGFLALYLYRSGAQPDSITPYLLSALIPIATTDFARHRILALNRFYVRMLGALMRETEYDGWNGVIWYLLGAWIVLQFPKDVGVMGVLLLSWCDTAASTVGRAWGKYAPEIRRGKSLAGSFAAFVVGALTAATFWGWLAPRTGPFEGDEAWPFMYRGTLSLPGAACRALGLTEEQGTIGGVLSLSIMSVLTGIVASTSEVVDLFGWDDNLTIPLLSGLGIWGFLKVFG